MSGEGSCTQDQIREELGIPPVSIMSFMLKQAQKDERIPEATRADLAKMPEHWQTQATAVNLRLWQWAAEQIKWMAHKKMHANSHKKFQACVPGATKYVLMTQTQREALEQEERYSVPMAWATICIAMLAHGGHIMYGQAAMTDNERKAQLWLGEVDPQHDRDDRAPH